MKERWNQLMSEDSGRTVVASLVSILIGLGVGSIVVIAVGLGNPSTLGASGAWEGVRLIFGGLFSTGRNAAGQLTWGFNPASIGNYFLILFRRRHPVSGPLSFPAS